MSRFSDRLARIESAVDREYADNTRIRPQSTVNQYAGSVDDVAHPAYEARGIPDFTSQLVQRKQTLGHAGGDHVDISMEMIDVSYYRAALGANPVPKQDWHIDILEGMFAGEELKILEVAPSGGTRVVCKCVRRNPRS